MRKLVSDSLLLLSVVVWGGPSALAQTVIHSRTIATPTGEATGLFEVSGGVLTSIPTGLPSNNFPSLSLDGRFIWISGPDPQFPNEVSDDLWVFDRLTRQTRKVIDNDTTTQPDGSIFFALPLFSAQSPNNQLVVVATQLGSSPGGTTRSLMVHRASDGFDLDLVELGQGNAIDFFRAEFLGISWAPDGSVFASPGYINIVTNRGRPSAAVGIALFGFDAAINSFVRVGQLTTPRVFEAGADIVIETHAFPVFSPNGRRLAFFSVTYPDPLLVGPATTALCVVDVGGTNRTTLLTFNPGFYPVGLSWTADGSQLAFSIAEQLTIDGFHSPLPVWNTAVLRLISAAGGQPPVPVPGAPFGIFPNVDPNGVPQIGPGSAFVRGDCDGDGNACSGVSDALNLLSWLFLGNAKPPCLASCDTNGNGEADLTDAVFGLDFCFKGTAPPVAPFPACGAGTLPEDDVLGCEAPPAACR